MSRKVISINVRLTGAEAAAVGSLPEPPAQVRLILAGEQPRLRVHPDLDHRTVIMSLRLDPAYVEGARPRALEQEVPLSAVIRADLFIYARADVAAPVPA